MPDILIGLAWWQLALAVVVALLASARLTRLVVHDSFPPALWARSQWDKLFKSQGWALLLQCAWCFGFWATAFVVGTFFLTFLATWIAWTWWLGFGILALSYPVSQYVYFDEGSPERD